MSSEKREYEVFTGLLGGDQVNTLSASFTLSCVKEYAAEHLGSAIRQYILHDGCDLRKPDSRELESLGHVMSLSKQVVRGYKTMNSVIVDARLNRSSCSAIKFIVIKCQRTSGKPS